MISSQYLGSTSYIFEGPEDKLAWLEPLAAVWQQTGVDGVWVCAAPDKYGINCPKNWELA